jgi:hypothetical protein
MLAVSRQMLHCCAPQNLRNTLSERVLRVRVCGACSSSKALHAASAALGLNMLTLELTSAECYHRSVCGVRWEGRYVVRQVCVAVGWS